MKTLIALLVLAAPASSAPADTRLHVDLNGDGDPEVVTMRQTPESITLTIASKRLPEPQVMEFGIDAGRQDAICGAPGSLKAIPLVCEPMDEPLPGCKTGQQAKGLVLAGGECDPIYLYWDHEAAEVAWWRL